jgi:AcrR family transcriptional regulator
MGARSTKGPEPSSADALSVRQRLVTAAERLFAERSWEAVGVRSIVAAANVHLSALNYHFGSKQQLLEDIFIGRARPIVEERMRRLEEIRKRKGTPCLEEILEAFLRPALSAEAHRGGATFIKLRARLGLAPDTVSRKILSDAFDQSDRLFLSEIKRALPGISAEDIEWRFHFLFGMMVYTMANVGRIESLTDGHCDTSDVELALQHLIPFLVAGFCSPPQKSRKRIGSRNGGGAKS